MRLQDRIAIVTGGGQGIGRATARTFAREGAKVAIAARSEDKLERVRSEIEHEGSDVLAVPTDVRLEDQVRRLVDATAERFGGLDIIVNNAGIGLNVAVEDVDMSDYDRLLDTNLKGLYLGCHFAVPLMKERGRGSIINISSVHGVDGSPLNSVYAATKGGIIGCTRSLSAELSEFRIRVNTISPGAIWLEQYADGWLNRVREEDRPELLERFGDAIRADHRVFQPLPVAGETDDIAYCALYLASDESRFVTGQNIVVDGGLTTYLSGSRDGSQAELEESRREMHAWIEEHAAE